MTVNVDKLSPRGDWRPDSWQDRPVVQQPSYPDPDDLVQVLKKLAELPPLVTSWEVNALHSQLARAEAGDYFVLQGGDCAESFTECQSPIISNRIKVMLQMSLVLVHGLKKRVVRIGRFAGQYAKPRSVNMETRGEVSLPSYRGDNINRSEFSADARIPDPQLLASGHAHAAMTLNFVRALVAGGFADLHHPEYWDIDFVKHSPLAAEYQRMVASISDSLKFMETLAGNKVGEIDRVNFYTSHEALHLHYEQAQTRQVPHQTGWYNLSTHLPWIGMRTADTGGAHVEYCRGIRNPVGIKVGPSMTTDWLRQLVEILDPDNVLGRLTLIHRFGAERIGDYLPPLLDAVRDTGRTVLWISDPMHGNTETTSEGYKTRRFDNILQELETAFDVHADNGSHLGGVHFELTGEDVTECIGGARGLAEVDLKRAYRSQVDPRLNYEQALEMAMLIVRKHQTGS